MECQHQIDVSVYNLSQVYGKIIQILIIVMMTYLKCSVLLHLYQLPDYILYIGHLFLTFERIGFLFSHPKLRSTYSRQFLIALQARMHTGCAALVLAHSSSYILGNICALKRPL